MPKPPMPPMEEEDEEMREGEPEAPSPRMAPDGDPTAPEEEEEEEEPGEEEDEDEEDEYPFQRKSVDIDPDDALATDTEILKGIIGSAVRDAVAPLHAKIKRLESLIKAVPTSVGKVSEELIAKSVEAAFNTPVKASKPVVVAASVGTTSPNVEKGVIAHPGDDNRGRARAACAKALGLMRDKRASIPAYNDVEYALRSGINVPDVALKALIEQIDEADSK